VRAQPGQTPARRTDDETPAEPARSGGSAVGPTGDGWRRVVRVRRSWAVRIALVATLIGASIATNRSFLGWGLFVLLAVMIVPLGRARSFIFSFVPYATVWFVFTALRSLADETVLAQTLSTKVPSFERWLFGGQLPTIMLQDRLYDPNHLSWYDYLCTAVHWSYFIIPHAVAILVWAKKPRLFQHYLSAMTLLLAVGLCIYFLIPTRPPWDAPETVDSPSQPYVHRPMKDVGEQLGGGLYQASYRVIGESNPWAAMPSIHMAITWLLVFPAFKFGRRWGYLAIAYAVLMGYSLIYLGEHYFVDVMVGVLITTYAWYASGTWLRRVYPIARRFMPGTSSRRLEGEMVPQPNFASEHR
jgi:membrane-associated phospholipid phosphatase